MCCVNPCGFPPTRNAYYLSTFALRLFPQPGLQAHCMLLGMEWYTGVWTKDPEVSVRGERGRAF